MALNFEQPDRVPVFATYVPEVEQQLRAEMGIDEFDLGTALGNDMVKSCAGLEMSFYGKPKPEYTDAWGIRWRYVENQFSVFTEIVEHPLAGDLSKVDEYQIPNPNEDSQYDNFRELKSLYGSEKYLVGSSQISIFEACWYLRGLDTFLMDMVTEEDYTNALMEKVMQFPLTAAKKYISLGADMVWFGDDVSMQTGMVISPDLWRKFLKPRYAKIFSDCKKENRNVKIAYHSCGNCRAILDEMIEIGLDVLNPLQPLAIDPFEIKKRYGKRLALFGGICVQQTMPYGSTTDVRSAVARLVKECGRGGGYILAPAHHIQADTRIENINAFYSAALSRDII
jgi:uroporphyrinogen decarboxylase